ncbi:MAG: Smr/MutS family protein [Thermoanaerobaculia bacterium]
MTESAVASPATRLALEFDALLAIFASEARTDLGAAVLRALSPAPDLPELSRRRALYEELGRLSLEAPLVPGLGEGFAELVDRLSGNDAALSGGEILRLGALLAAGGEAVARISRLDPPSAELRRLVDGIADPQPLVRQIGRILDRKGEVRDDASPRLAELRRQVQGARERLYGRLEAIGGAHRELLGEETIPLRSGRLMLMVQAGTRGKLAGLVHGRSATGKSLYFEPLEVVEENNTLQSANDELEAERQRLLQELLRAIAAEAPLVAELAALVGTLDALESSRRLARELDAVLPALSPDGRLHLIGARHPLLDPRLARRRERVLGARGHEGAVVPLTLELAGDRRALVITGPNAGGKTVALKTLGLLVLAAQSGLPIPVAPGSAMPWFSALVATVGDEQDLLADRSTFSGRLARLAEAYLAAGPQSLALLDELGSGTDPEEGTALAVALLERLVERGGLALITTHLTGLAAAALELPGAACAAMEFEPSSGRPTFRLLPGSPGGSEALALARRMELPFAWIARAETLLGDEHRDLRNLLAELEVTREALARETEETRAERAAMTLSGERLERERAALEAERQTVGARARRELSEFRERVARDLAGAAEKMRAELEAGRKKSVAQQAVTRLFADAPQIELESGPVTILPLTAGAAVRHRTLGWRGTVESMTGSRVEVMANGKRLKLAAEDLIVEATAAGSSGSAGSFGTAAGARRSPAAEGVRRPAAAEEESVTVAPELHLIGQRVEPALEELDAFLDQAMRSGRREVRIVHGHGSGRLRNAIREHLRQHRAAVAARAGAPNEGGNGATVVTLRD